MSPLRLASVLAILLSLALPARPAQVGNTWSGPYDYACQLNANGCNPYAGDFREISHAALLPTGLHRGKVLIWARNVDSNCNPTATTSAWLFNPASPSLLELIQTDLPSDIFCGGQSFAGDGTLVVVGGFPLNGVPEQSYRFDPTQLGSVSYPLPGAPVCSSPVIAISPTGSPWSAPFNASVPRYYPTLLTLARRDIQALCMEAGGTTPIATTIPGGAQLVIGGPADTGINPGTQQGWGTDIWQFLPPGTGAWAESYQSSAFALGPVPATGMVFEYDLDPTQNPPPEVRLDSYPRAFQLADPTAQISYNGQIFVANDVDTGGGPFSAPNSPGSSWALKPPLPVTQVCWELSRGRTAVDAFLQPLDRYYGTAVIVHEKGGFHNRLLTFGGSRWVGSSREVNNSVQEYQISSGSLPQDGIWLDKQPLIIGRLFTNAVVLPNGQILIVGGSREDCHHGGDCSPNGPANNGAPIFQPELYDIGTSPTAPGSSTLLAASNSWTDPHQPGNVHGPTPRMYHNIALLLGDGRVFVAGGANRYLGIYPGLWQVLMLLG